MPRYDFTHWSQQARERHAPAPSVQVASSASASLRSAARPSRPKPPRDDGVEHLLRLCREGRLFELQAWVADGKPLTVPAGYRRRPLRVALETGFHSLIAFLLQHETDQETKDTALRDSLWANRPGLIELAHLPVRAKLPAPVRAPQMTRFERFYADKVGNYRRFQLVRDGAYHSEYSRHPLGDVYCASVDERDAGPNPVTLVRIYGNQPDYREHWVRKSRTDNPFPGGVHGWSITADKIYVPSAPGPDTLAVRERGGSAGGRDELHLVAGGHAAGARMGLPAFRQCADILRSMQSLVFDGFATAS